MNPDLTTLAQRIEANAAHLAAFFADMATADLPLHLCQHLHVSLVSVERDLAELVADVGAAGPVDGNHDDPAVIH